MLGTVAPVLMGSEQVREFALAHAGLVEDSRVCAAESMISSRELRSFWIRSCKKTNR